MSGPTFPWRVGILAAVAVLATAVGVWYGFLRPTRAPESSPGFTLGVRPADPPPPDPRTAFATPFRNVRPGVAYVGDRACAGCHGELVNSFHAHPMGHSADWTPQAAPLERYDQQAHNPFTALRFAFQIDRTDGRMTHRVSPRLEGVPTQPEYERTAAVAVGSGTRGRTYLVVEDGAVWQSPVSWFTKDARWDLSPQHELDQGGRRAIVPGCLHCHTDRVEPIPGAVNRYRMPLFPGQVNIGCERCHGPGELHVRARRQAEDPAGVDYSIVNPKHLPPDLRQDVCRQCHLQGVERVVRRGRDLFEYRPGLPWDQFVTTFMLRPERSDFRRSVGQFEQLESSRCFLGSGGKLDCVACHDPHRKPTGPEAERFYRNRCLTCHADKGCSAPAAERTAREDSCTTCHMPRADSSNIAHASITDHRILRRPTSDDSPRGAPPGIPFVAYPPGPHAPSADERRRDEAIAVGRMAGAVPEARPLLPAAAERLTRALAHWPGDVEAWTTLAAVHGAAGQGADAVAAAKAAVEVAADSEPAWSRLAQEARLAGDLDAALAAGNTLVEMSPTALPHRLGRAEVYLRRRQWPQAEADARAALTIQPWYWKARLYLAVCRHHQGKPAQAQQDAVTAVKLLSSERQRIAYMNWYRAQTQ